MKKWSIGFLIGVLLITGSMSVLARPHRPFYGGNDRPHYGGPPPVYRVREDARYIIHRTAQVIYDAQHAAEFGHRYDGLRLAIGHQQRARQLYDDALYQEAIYHSLRARDLAVQVIQANRERPRREYFWDATERRYAESAPRKDKLDIKLDFAKVGDELKLVHWRLGLDINK